MAAASPWRYITGTFTDVYPPGRPIVARPRAVNKNRAASRDTK